MPEEEIDRKRLNRIGTQELSLLELNIKGRILDIGGGGEGIIGQLFSDQVIAIDPNLRELMETPEGPVKIVMDATELKFLEGTFDFVTSFFTLMFIPNYEHQRVFDEIFRVLKPGGVFKIWDINIPPYDGRDKDIYVVPLKLHLPDKVLETGYGTRWKDKEQNMEYFCCMAESAGFKVADTRIDGEVILMDFIRI